MGKEKFKRAFCDIYDFRWTSAANANRAPEALG